MDTLVLSCSGDRPSEFLKGLPLADMEVVDHRRRQVSGGRGGVPPTAKFRKKR